MAHARAGNQIPAANAYQLAKAAGGRRPQDYGCAYAQLSTEGCCGSTAQSSAGARSHARLVPSGGPSLIASWSFGSNNARRWEGDEEVEVIAVVYRRKLV